MHWVFLFIAIVCETIASATLKLSDGFTKLVPSVCFVVSLLVTLYCSALAVKAISLSVVYALWSGIGMVLITAIGWFYFGQKLDAAAFIGLAFILIGIVILHTFSKSLKRSP